MSNEEEYLETNESLGRGDPDLHVQDEKSPGTNGGTFNSGAWRTRDLNTVKANEINGASLSSNQITLPSGDFYVEASAPGYTVNRHIARIYNVTDSSLIISGSTEYSGDNGGYAVTDSVCVGRFSLASSKNIELQHQCAADASDVGFGQSSGSSSSISGVDHETYSIVKIWKVG